MTAVAAWARRAIMTNFVDTTDSTCIALAYDATTLACLHELAETHDPTGFRHGVCAYAIDAGSAKRLWAISAAATHVDVFAKPRADIDSHCERNTSRSQYMSVPEEMNAVTIDRFGGLEVLQHGRQQVPEVGPGEVLIRVAYAGVGAWDPLEREGVFVEITGEQPEFPFTPGGDGSGTVTAVGPGVDRFSEGDEVYALGGGFYAEYVSLDSDLVSLVPDGLELVQAGAMPIVALTALHGLVDELRVKPGEALLITGASGDVGHLAVQLAKRLGARVLAVASGADGVEAVAELGADLAVDGRTSDVAAAAREFAPAGLDAVLSLVGGAAQDMAIAALHKGGRVAYPLGVQPEPEPISGVELRPYDLTLDSPASTKLRMGRLNDMITAGPFSVRVSKLFPLDQAPAAQRALEEHRVGKIVLETTSDVLSH